MRDAVLIAGPTASGKSALALAVARRTGGVIVNADSMQVYGVLDLLTARPDAAALAAAPHRLYGHVPPACAYSTGRWLADVAALVEAGAFAGRRAIFVGGTGLYFRALTEGLAPMPDIPAALRARLRRRLAAEGSTALHRALATRDPETAARLQPGDGQRIVRALEVLEASGRPIGAWQAARSAPLVDLSQASALVIEPDRAALAAAIERRFDGMLEAGALEEVAALRALALDPALPAMKAIGVRELSAVLDGQGTLAEAAARAKAATRQYAKRQATWFRHQLGPAWRRYRSAQAALEDPHGVP